MEIKLLNTVQAAEFLGIHPMTLKIKARSGEIPAGRSGRKWTFVNIDLIEYVRAQYKVKKMNADIGTCPSINAKIHLIGGLKSNSTEESYLAALGLSTASKPKNTMTD
jgi:excisionase family DNA binding protein